MIKLDIFKLHLGRLEDLYGQLCPFAEKLWLCGSGYDLNNNLIASTESKHPINYPEQLYNLLWGNTPTKNKKSTQCWQLLGEGCKSLFRQGLYQEGLNTTQMNLQVKASESKDQNFKETTTTTCELTGFCLPLIAVVLVDHERLFAWAQQHQLNIYEIEDLCRVPEVETAVLASLSSVAREAKLSLYERVRGVHLVSSANLRLPRKELHQSYSTVLKSKFASLANEWQKETGQVTWAYSNV